MNGALPRIPSTLCLWRAACSATPETAPTSPAGTPERRLVVDRRVLDRHVVDRLVLGADLLEDLRDTHPVEWRIAEGRVVDRKSLRRPDADVLGTP